MNNNPVKIREEEWFTGGKSLFVTYYKGAGDRYALFIPPLFEELPRTRKLMVNAARALAAVGVSVIRFDYYGTGLSFGSFSDFSLRQAREDISVMIEDCRRRGAVSLSLLGFRFGAYLAAESSGRPGIDRTVLWEPVLNPAEYLEECFKSLMVDQIVTYGTVKFTREQLMERMNREGHLLVNGYDLSCSAAEQFRAARVLGADDLKRSRIVLWRRSTLNKYPFLEPLAPVMCSGVKSAWDHIKFMDYSPEELLQTTVRLIRNPESSVGSGGSA